MQTMVFTGRLAADPQISPDFAKAVFRLLEKRGVDAAGKDRLVGVNCVSWSRGLNEKVIAAKDGTERTAKELVVNRLTVLDWAEDRDAAGLGASEDGRVAA
jgi:hypothetical protein